MNSGKKIGGIVGALLLLHLAAGLMLPFILLQPLNSPPGFLTNAATMPNQVRTAVMMLFVGAAMPIGIMCVALPLFQRYSSAAAYWLLALGVASFVLQAADNAHLLSMLSLSRAFAEAAPADARVFQIAGTSLGAIRKWSHYSFLLSIGCWIFLLYGFLYWFRLVPRWLAGTGVLCAAAQIAGVTLRGLWGLAPETRLAMPLAPAYAALAGWLIYKGLDPHHHRTPEH